MGQGQSRRESAVAAFSDPFAGEPLRGDATAPDVFSDPFAGEPLRVATKSDNLPPRDPTWAQRLGLHEPTDSMLGGFLRGAGTGAVDLAQGAVSEIANAMAQKQVADSRPVAPITEETNPDVSGVSAMDAPASGSGQMGRALPHVAAMAVPVGGAAKAAYEAVPRAARAGEKFQEVMGAARNVPVNVQEVGNVALRINQLAERGGMMPMAVRKLLNRLTDPNKAAMAYEESRDFASNISRLSADEMKRLTPVLRREVAKLSAELNRANAEAAKAAGKGAEYKSAMREYARAMQMKDALDTVIRKAKQAALPAAGLGGAAYWLGRD